MSDVNPARLAAWLQRQNPSFSCPADDMTLEYCARVAEVTDASAADDLQTLTDLLNDLMSQHAPDDSALLLQPDAVTAWLRGGDDGTETDGTPHNAATAAQGPNSSEAHTLGGQSQQGVCAAATGEDTVAKQQSGFTPSPSTGPQQHQWNVSASEFVPRPPQPGHHTTDTHSPAQPTTSTTPNPPGTDAGAHADAGAWDWDQGSALHGDAHAWEGTWGDEPDTQHAARGTHGPARVTRLQGNSHAWEDRQGSALHGGTEWADTHGPAGAWEGVWGEDWGYTDDYQDYDNTHHSIAGVSGGAGLGPTGDDMNPEQLLAGMFPSYAPTLLTQLLQSHKGDISAAVDELLLLDTIEGQGTDTDTSPTTHAAYRQGTGTGQTAQAGHGGTDAAAPPQHGGGRPMQPGGPLAGDESGISGVMPLTDSDAFPALGSIGAGGTSSVGARSSQGASMGAQPAASSWAKVANSATHKAPAPAPAPPPTQPSLAAARSVSHRVGGSGLQAAAASVPRVETGVTLASQYQGARQEASDWARARNMCFQQATLAYLSGNKALARELSRRGKEYANRMWSAHERAVEDLMHTRQAIRHVPGGPMTIDLHGLHISEALSVLHQYLDTQGHTHVTSGATKAPHTATRHQRDSQGTSDVLHVIVGLGKHSKTAGVAPQGRLLLAVQKEMDSLGLRWSEPQPGLIAVRLRGT